jgi:MFS family permease
MRAARWFAPPVADAALLATERRLPDWRGAGLLDEQQVEGILAHERATQQQDPQRSSRGWQAEIVGYVGAAFALGAALLLLAEFYSDLLPVARAVLAGLVMLAGLLAGAALAASESAALRRLTAVLWTGSLAATAWTAGVIAGELVRVDPSWLATAVGAPTLLVGTLLLSRGRHELVQLATLAALITTTVGLLTGTAVLPPEQLAVGTLLLGLGLAWGLAGAGGWLGPRWTAEVAGGLIALVGTQIIATGDRRVLGLILGLVLAAAAVALAVPTARPRLLGLGAVALFILVPQLVFELFADTLGAPATLLAVGLVLIVLAVGLGRVRSVTTESADRVEDEVRRD